MIELLLYALLSVMSPSATNICIKQRVPEIVGRIAVAYLAHGVPASVLLVVARLETGFGCARGSGGNWGAPVSPTRRHTPGTSLHAARALATSYRVCHTRLGAVSRFRCGQCVCRQRMTPNWYSPAYAVSLANRIEREAGYVQP